MNAPNRFSEIGFDRIMISVDRTRRLLYPACQPYRRQKNRVNLAENSITDNT